MGRGSHRHIKLEHRSGGRTLKRKRRFFLITIHWMHCRYGAVSLWAIEVQVCYMSYGRNGNFMCEWTGSVVFSSLVINFKDSCWLGPRFCAVLEFRSVFGQNLQRSPFWDLLEKMNACWKCIWNSFAEIDLEPVRCFSWTRRLL